VAFYARRELEPTLAELKVLASKGLSLRGRSVLRQRDFAVALHALGRDDDALAVADWPQRSVQFRGKGDAWYAANAAWAVASRIRRRRGNAAVAMADLQRFVDQPAHALLTQPHLWNEARMRELAGVELRRFDDASKRAGPLAADSMAWAAAELTFFRETAVPPFPHAGFELGWLETATEGLLRALAARLRQRD